MSLAQILLAVGSSGGLLTIIGALIVRNTTLKVEAAKQVVLANAQRTEENRAKTEENRLSLEVLESAIRALQAENDRKDRRIEAFDEMVHARDGRIEDLQQQLDLHNRKQAPP